MRADPDLHSFLLGSHFASESVGPLARKVGVLVPAQGNGDGMEWGDARARQACGRCAQPTEAIVFRGKVKAEQGRCGWRRKGLLWGDRHAWPFSDTCC